MVLLISQTEHIVLCPFKMAIYIPNKILVWETMETDAVFVQFSPLKL